MRATNRLIISACLVALLFGGPSIAAGQTPSSGPSQGGPLVLSPIPASIVFSPEAKVTTINNVTAVLAGASIGRLVEHTVYVGGAAYGLTTHRDSTRLWYGGVLVGWRVYGSDRFNVSARSLFGLGQGTVFDTVRFADFDHRYARTPSGDVRVGYRDDFAVLEPELRVVVAITDALSLNVGGGYRATSAYRGLSDLLDGATASVGIQFNIGR